jgi:hypothetical protein
MVLHALWLVFLARQRWLKLHIGVADAEHVGRHLWLAITVIVFFARYGKLRDAEEWCIGESVV